MKSASNFQSHFAIWKKHAVKLAEWTLQHLAVRTDDHGCYSPKPWRAKKPLTKDVLIAHFASFGYPVGLYTTDPTDDCSTAVVWDIDAHDEAKDANWQIAEDLYHRLRERGLYALVEDSNGNTGYKVRLVFNQRVPARLLRSFGHWMLKDIMPDIEVFPKQDQVSTTQQKMGNFVRLPGRHHKHREHWSAFWDGDSWQHGEEAIRFWLGSPVNDPDRIPDEAREFIPPKKEPKLAEHPHEELDGDWLAHLSGDLATLRLLDCFEDHNMLERFSGGGWWAVRCPWQEAHTTGDDLAYVLHEEGQWPVFKCHHAHCEGRRLQDVVEWFGTKMIDNYCDQRFGKDDTDLHLAGEAASAKVKDAPEPQKDKRRRRGYKISELVSLPPLQWQVESHFARNSLCIMYGEWETGKSFVAQDMALSIASGRMFLDQFEVASGAVMYICSEGQAGISKRILAWMKDHQVAEIDNFIIVPCSFDFTRQEEAVAALEIAKVDLGALPQFTVVDTIPRNMMGDENSPKDMTAFVRNLDVIREATGGTVLGLTHRGKDVTKKVRGHTSLMGAADTIIQVESAGGIKGEQVRISLEKQKDFARCPSYSLRRRLVGESLVYDFSGYIRDVDDKSMEQFLAVFPTAPDEAVTVTDLRQRTGLSRKDVDGKLTILQKRGVVLPIVSQRKNEPHKYYRAG